MLIKFHIIYVLFFLKIVCIKKFDSMNLLGPLKWQIIVHIFKGFSMSFCVRQIIFYFSQISTISIILCISYLFFVESVDKIIISKIFFFPFIIITKILITQNIRISFFFYNYIRVFIRNIYTCWNFFTVKCSFLI